MSGTQRPWKTVERGSALEIHAFREGVEIQRVAVVSGDSLARENADLIVTAVNDALPLLELIVAEWDQYFDAEGPMPEGGYRWSSQTAAELIERARKIGGAT